jgi:four helix bundle protein
VLNDELLRISEEDQAASKVHSPAALSEIADNLRARTMRFAVRVAGFYRSFTDTWEGRHVADQLFRSSTSLAANYTAACRGRSPREFVAKLGLVVEETDETLFWLTFAIRAELAAGSEAAQLSTEAQELLAIFTVSVKTAAANLRKRC